MPHTTLHTARLQLVPITLPIVEAMMTGRRADAEKVLEARLPDAWPGRALVERAFSASLERIRENPGVRLWGDRVMLARSGPRRVVGSVVFHGAPGGDGTIEVAYGVEHESQGQGYATEAVGASVTWALSQSGVHVVRATTTTWHVASRRVLEKCGFALVGSHDDGDMVGELLEYERRG